MRKIFILSEGKSIVFLFSRPLSMHKIRELERGSERARVIIKKCLENMKWARKQVEKTTATHTQTDRTVREKDRCVSMLYSGWFVPLSSWLTRLLQPTFEKNRTEVGSLREKEPSHFVPLYIPYIHTSARPFLVVFGSQRRRGIYVSLLSKKMKTGIYLHVHFIIFLKINYRQKWIRKEYKA